jgi:hypothetical protein
MAMLWEALSATPSENGNRPAPTGAPEGTFTIGQTNETFRWLMAAVAEMGAWVRTSIAGLATMAYQAASAVTITGGSIAGCTLGSSNSLDAGALKSGTVDAARLPVGTIFNPQVAYDLAWPVGSQRLWNSTTLTGLVPTGVAATWSRISAAQDALLAVAGSTRAYGASGSGTTVTVAAAGAHDHGGTTGGHALTMAELPAALLVNSYGEQDNGGLFSKGSNARIDQDANTGGGQAHSHGIPSTADHTHAATLPKVFSTILVERIA